ncbi:MAG: hypothetical protein JWM58_1865 [Rhizobium sp.]|nr:hypothetical protein [Rhizobium sp.]
MNIRYIAPLFSLLLPVAATAADDREAVRAACKADVKAHCGTIFSRSKAMTCLIEKAAVLSAPCTTALKVASCNAKAPANLKAAFACAE